MKKLSLPDDRYRPTEKLIGPSLSNIIVYKGKCEETKNSVLIWKILKHTESDFQTLEKTENNSKFLQIFEKFQIKEKTAHFFISESPKLGTLADYVKLNGPLNEILIRSIMNQLLEAADFLQRNQLGHLCFDCENIFVESAENTKNNEDTFYTTDYCKHIRDLSLSLLTIMLGLLRGQKRKDALLAVSEVAQDEYRRETEALANELMLKAFCGNVEYSVDSDIRFPFKSLLAFKHHHFSPPSLTPSSSISDISEKSAVSAPIPTTAAAAAPPQQPPPPFQRAPSEAYQSRTPSRTANSHGIGRSAASLKSAKSSKSLKSVKSMKSLKSGKSCKSSVSAAGAAHWPLPRLPTIGQRVSRVTEYGRFIYETNGKAVFEYTNGTNFVQGICEVLKVSDKQKVRLYKPIKSCPLPSSSEEAVKKFDTFEKEFDSIKKLDSTAICLYHMICNDVEAFLSHTPAWILRSPFALPRIVGVIMHNGDVHLTFGDTGFVYWRKHNSSEIISLNNGGELGDEQIEVFEAISQVLEAHRTAWVSYSFIRMLKTDLSCHLALPSPIFPINHQQCGGGGIAPYMLVRPQVHYNTDEQYLESLEEFNRISGIITYGTQMPSTSTAATTNGNG
uniref:Protein kinase domain-containing protein n=1 Tax=Panagrolaimus sp. PS1159 TaxID=55785 RepID=A0AC35EWL3_9BILA